jgi:hypothetical protein
MAKKRLTDLDKWKKPFFRKLPYEYKLFWLYLLDDCDHCGIWHVDLEIAEIKLGFKLSLKKAQGLFEERVVEFDNGTKWFVPDFVQFQYGVLDDRNKMSKAVLPVLEKYNLMGHISPINGGIVKVKVRDIVSKDSEINQQIIFSEKLLVDVGFFETIAMAWGIDKKGLEKMSLDFEIFLNASDKKHPDYKEYKTHFYNWGVKRYTDYLAGKKKMVL